MNKKCGNCALKATDQSGTAFCQLRREPINLETDYCSKHQFTLEQCERCKQYLAGLPVIKYSSENSSEFTLVCQNCSKMP